MVKWSGILRLINKRTAQNKEIHTSVIKTPRINIKGKGLEQIVVAYIKKYYEAPASCIRSKPANAILEKVKRGHQTLNMLHSA